MSVYQYAGVDQKGKSVAGKIEAASERLAYDQLNHSGIVPTSLAIGEKATAAESAAKKTAFGRRIPFSTRAMFVRELGTFIHADIPLLDALDVLRRQEHNPAFKDILDDLHSRVQGGEQFSKALSAHPKIFSHLLVSMVKVGETGGVMAPVLEQMATWMEHEEEVRGEIVSALAYPVMILMLGVGTVVILLTFVLPRISSVFAGMEANLPLPTKILMGTSGFMTKWWWAFPLVVGVIYFAFAKILATPGGRRRFDWLAISVPIVGALNLKSSIARFARANAALLSSGVPLLEALRVVKGLLTNSILVKMLDDVVEGVTRGQSLASMLEQSPYFPPAAIHLLRVGERTGRLPDMFGRVAQTFEKQTRNQIKVMLNLLSPLMIVALAVLVAMIAIAILLPIFQMNQLMK